MEDYGMTLRERLSVDTAVVASAGNAESMTVPRVSTSPRHDIE